MRALAVALLLLFPQVGWTAAKPRIAVLDIRALGTDKEKAELLSEIVLSELGAVQGLDVIGSSDIQSMIGFERQKQLLGCSEGSCLAEIGGALGVSYMLVGTLGKLGSLYRIDLKIIDVNKGKVAARIGQNVEGKEEAIVSTAQKVARMVLDKSGVLKAAEKADAETKAAAAAKPPPAKAAEPEPKAVAAEPLVASSSPSTLDTQPATAGLSAEAKPSRTGAWISLGAGGAALVGGVLFGLSAKSALADEQTASNNNDLGGYETARSAVRTRSILADSLFVAGAAAVGIGVYLYLSDSGSSESSNPVALRLDGGAGRFGLSVSGGF